MKLWKLIVVLFACWLCTTANAILVTLPLQQRLPIENKTDGLRLVVAKEAFDRLILVTTGNGKSLKNKKIRLARDSVDAYISKYNYYETPEAGLNIQINFDRKAIRHLLASANYSYLGKNRPATVIWLAFDADNYDLGVEALKSTLLANIEELCNERGLPLILPLMDLLDKEIVSDDDIRDFSHEKLLKASKRYDASLVLVAKMSKADDSWIAKWSLYSPESSVDWSNENQSLSELLESAVDTIGHSISELTINKSGGNAMLGTTAISIIVSGIGDMQAYSKVQDYLQSIDAVDKVEVKDVGPDSVVFMVHSKVNTQTIAATIGVERTLAVDKSNATGSIDALAYKLRHTG